MKYDTASFLRFSTSVLFLICFTTSLKAQFIWNFDEAEPLKTISGEGELSLHSIKNTTELTSGIIGKGFRTAGYTGWLTAEIEPVRTPYSISGWFALESFPTDTAAFLGVRDTVTQQSLAVVVDRFGDILISVGRQDTYKYRPTSWAVERFKWISVALSVGKEQADIFIDGVRIPNVLPAEEIPARIHELIVAKDFRDKQLGGQHLTIINGIVDELRFSDSVVDTEKLTNEVVHLSNNVPVLAIPKSRFQDDFSRPKYHLLPAGNWTNETHGLIYYKGKYHIFNQKNASNLHLLQINWGHFSSPDLINWIEHKPVLTPEKGYDQNGIWSGHVVINDEGVPVIFYTSGGKHMGVGMAFPKDSDLIEWVKYEGNPIILGQPEGYSRSDLRDPYVWREGDIWYMIIGFGIEDERGQRGAVLLYSSIDLKNWNFLHPLFEGNPEVDNTGIFWEMPVFKKVDGKYVLLINKVPHNGVPARSMYWIGDFKHEKFIPDNPLPQNLEVINRLLSPSVAYDKDSLITAIAIIPDEIGGEAARQHGWTHLYSIPRVWELKESKLIQKPHPVLKNLRDKSNRSVKTVVQNGEPLQLVSGHQYEVQATFSPNQAKKFGFILYKNPDNSEFTKIYYDVVAQEIIVDQSHSSLRKDIPLLLKKEPYPLDVSAPVDFHIYVDGSVVEIFINEQDAFTSRIFPLKESSKDFCVFSEGGNIEISANIWPLKPAQMDTDF